MIVQCGFCGCDFEKEAGQYNRAVKRGLKVYCSLEHSALGRRCNKSIEQKKSEKSAYDKVYRRKNIERIKARKHEYFTRTYEPTIAAIERKKRMPRHVEYCRRPEYKKWKKEYDKKHRAKKHYGEFYEAAIILNEIDIQVDSREAYRHNKLYLKATNNRKRKNGNEKFKRN